MVNVAGEHWSVARLVEDLHRLGIADGDVVMVHASLRSLGPVDGGAAGVVEALDRAVGERGTILMTVGASDAWSWVNDRPEVERRAILAGAEPFDCDITPADPDVGVLAEVVRTTPGTFVSDHPEGRFAARGHLAATLVSDVPWNDYYGPGSPLERFVTAGGKVLRLGADPATVTLIHYAEFVADVPNKRRLRRYRRVVSSAGPVVRTVDCLDDSNGIADYPGEDYFAVILGDYLSSRRVPSGPVGSAHSELLDAADLVEFAANWMTAHL